MRESLVTMQIWPAIDLRGGKCVRLEQGDYDRETVFGDEPVEMARRWVRAGAQCLHLVDLDGARDGRPANHAVAAEIVAAVDVPCQLGGGIRDETVMGSLLDAGLARLVVGTKALREPDWFRSMCRRFPNKLALGIDARDGRIATDGWLQTSDMVATEMAALFAGEPIATIIYTDIATDGMMNGPNVDAMDEMNRAVEVPVTASGGIRDRRDVEKLAALDLAGCIIGRALYEGKLTIRDAIDAAQQTGKQ